MSALSDKILSYSPEQYIRFNTAYSLSPTNLGSGGTGTFALSNEAPVLVSNGGPDGEGHWDWNLGSTTDTTTTRFRILSDSSPATTPEFTDFDFSYGYWFKISQPMTVSGGSPIMAQISKSSINTLLSRTSGTVGRLTVSTSGATPGTVTSSNRVDDRNWHYFAAIVTTNGTTQTANYYLDGTFFGTQTFPNGTLSAYVQFGQTTPAAGEATLTQLSLAHFYVAPTSVINATAVSQIWTSGQSGSSDVGVLETPATATALQVLPTRSISSNNLEAPATASCEFPNPTLFTTLSADILGDAMTASALQVDPLFITTDSNSVNIETSISIDALMVHPLVTTDLSSTVLVNFSLDASAESVDPTLQFTSDVLITETIIDVTAESFDVTLTLTANQNLSVPATTANAVLPTNIYITSDDAVVYSATPMFASNAEIPNPSYGAVNPDPLYYTPGTLRSKIATYPIEFGVEFNSAAVNNATTTYGSNTVGTAQPQGFSLYGDQTYSTKTDGPYASGTNSVEFYSAGGGRMAFASSTAINDSNIDSNVYNDYNFTAGVWFRVLEAPTGTSPLDMNIFSFQPSSFTVGTNPLGQGFVVALSGTSHASNPTRLNLYTGGTTFSFFGPTTLDTGWHYVAVRRTSQSATNNFEVYLDGALALTRTVTTTGTTSTRLTFGPGTNATYTAFPPSQKGRIRYQNFHSGTAGNLTPFRINEIYLAGTNFPPAQSINAVHNAPPAYANATMIAPTIVAVIGDNVEIVTSILVSATMPNPDWSTGERVTVNADVLGTATVELGDNITLDTYKDHVVAPQEFIATAVFPMPRISEFPFYATAEMKQPTVYISPNRFAMVMNQNPLFYIEDGQTAPQNYGSWNVNSWRTEYFDTNVQAGQELNAVGNQKAWRANANSIILREPELEADITDYEQKIEALYATKTLSIELWYWSIAKASGGESGFRGYTESGILFSDGISQIGEVYDWYNCGPRANPSNDFVLISNLIGAGFGLSAEDPEVYVLYRTYYDAKPKPYQWNHVVMTYEPIVGEPNKINQKVYMNGSIIGNNDLTISPQFGEFNFDIDFNSPSQKGPRLGHSVALTGSQQIKLNDGVKLDEFAIYPVTLSPTQVVERYNFIRSLSPNAEFFATARNVQAAMGNHTFVAVRNFVFEEDPMPALASRIPEPVVIAGKDKIMFPAPCEANAEMANPTVQRSVNYLADPARANAELMLPNISNNLYYQYVKSTINPYRYVSFDTNNEIEDHGTDDDYSVIPTVINGTITQYKDGINNKSVKTSGLAYTDGVILKESEWNDTWGTGQNTYHSAFWVERAEDDNSSGLRVLWNLNSYLDDQHVILYQYNNKLHLNFNNGSGTFIDQATVSNFDLFNYTRHLVVIAFDHSNVNNNVVNLYVDQALVMTVNLGSYTGTTVNYGSAVPANDELYNHPRLGVGCLITQFASTSLPVLPTVTKLYVDEIHWAKTAINLAGVQALYNAMPAKVNRRNFATPLTAAAESVMPTTSASVNFVAGFMEAFASQTEPIVYSEFYVSNTADAMIANADMGDVQRSDSRTVVAGVMLAGASMGGFGTPRLVNAPAITATALLQNRRVLGLLPGEGSGIRINGIRTFEPVSAWVKYAKINNETSIIPMGGVN